MPFSAFAMPWAVLSVLAVALPFLFAVTAPPSPNFWPLVFAWCCGAVLAAGALAWGAMVRTRAQGSRLYRSAAGVLALGLLLASVVGGVVGLLQYMGVQPLESPWIHPSVPGQAVGNLRQRNQQATLMAMGVWALLWLWVCTAQAAPRWQRAGRGWDRWLGVSLAMCLPLLAVASAATVSRTGAVQWLVMVVLVCLWRNTPARRALPVAMLGVGVYVLAAWALPQLLLPLTGVQGEGLFARLAGEGRQCASRQVMWSNMLHLISLKPWTGWGWGDMGYAHYMTLFPGERFCMLLDNAHNLPLHLAVELGLPVALLLCGCALAGVIWARPWRETDPMRQLAWGLLALVGVHSALEYPLWYGPFQVVSVFALLLLVVPRTGGSVRFWLLRLGTLACVAGVALLAMATYEYRVVSQLYKPVSERPIGLRNVRAVPAPSGTLFPNQIRFAWLTTHELTAANAQEMHAVALALLHFSPEPRVVEKLIASAQALGRDDEVALHVRRYRIAYPADHARWLASGAGREAVSAGYDITEEREPGASAAP